MTAPLMPKATAIWLIENTTLTFKQVAEFCKLHELEVQAIADGDIAAGLAQMDPIATCQLTREEIERCENDANAKLKLNVSQEILPKQRKSKYTPMSKRQDKPSAIAWLVKHYPDLPDAKICRLLGTTQPTVKSIREKTHWNSKNIRGMSPVELGLCSIDELEMTTKGYTKV